MPEDPVTLILDNLCKKRFRGRGTLESKKRLKPFGPLSYIDLLVLTLTQHEKELNLIINKLEEISEKLEEISLQLSRDGSIG